MSSIYSSIAEISELSSGDTWSENGRSMSCRGEDEEEEDAEDLESTLTLSMPSKIWHLLKLCFSFWPLQNPIKSERTH